MARSHQAGLGDAVNATTGPFCFVTSGYGATSGMLVAKEPGATAGNASRLTVNTFISSSSALVVVLRVNSISPEPGYQQHRSTPTISYGRLRQLQKTLGTVSSTPLFVVPNMAAGPDSFFGGSACVLEAAQADTLGYTDDAWTGNVPSGALLDYIGATQAGAYQIASLYPGLGYNYSAMNYAGGLQYRGLQADIVHTNDQGRFVTNLYSDGGLEESYDMGLWKPSSTTSATSLFPEDVLSQGVINSVSQYAKGNFYQYEAGITPSGANVWVPATKFSNATTISTAYSIGKSADVATAAHPFRCVSLDGTANNPNIYFDLSGGKNGDASDYGGNLSNA